MQTPQSIEEIQEAVQSRDRTCVRGGGTKSALSGKANLSLAGLSGVLEYEPTEYTFTALAGTPLKLVADELAKNGQFLPFDPPFVEAGGTLGGTVATGLSGSGRFRFGGLREFILGVKFVAGDGRLVFGGGKVVKNAAGFDIPKLMVGSLGQFGVMVELTFKVFPVPETTTTLRVEFADQVAACSAMTRVLKSQTEAMCLDLEAPARVWIRIAGMNDSQVARVERLKGLLAGATAIDVLRGADEARVWSDSREFRWVSEDRQLIKMPITPNQIPQVTALCREIAGAIPMRFSVGGNVAWLAWPNGADLSDLDAACRRMGRTALTITGKPSATPLVGSGDRHNAFEQRLLSVFDSDGRFQSAAEVVTATV